jgi:DNA invertase Pin-like site-specific DNA recombinase
MRVAIYARVSTDRHERLQTIDSQLTALHAWVTAQGHELRPDHIYRDEGASGAHLDRPGLDSLRDAARNGDFELVGVLSPDRLARNTLIRSCCSKSSAGWAVRPSFSSAPSPTIRTTNSSSRFKAPWPSMNAR